MTNEPEDTIEVTVTTLAADDQLVGITEHWRQLVTADSPGTYTPIALCHRPHIARLVREAVREYAENHPDVDLALLLLAHDSTRV